MAVILLFMAFKERIIAFNLDQNKHKSSMSSILIFLK